MSGLLVQIGTGKSIAVSIRREGEYVFAENESLRIYAHGRDLDEALHSFKQHVAHFRQYYAALGEHQLIGDAVRLKRVFATAFPDNAKVDVT